MSKKSSEVNREPIDMVEGKWAFRRDPWSAVRVVSLVGNPDWPVITIDGFGVLREHSRSGVHRTFGGQVKSRKAYDLVHCVAFGGPGAK